MPGQTHLVLVGTSILRNTYELLKSRGESACLSLLAACVDRSARDPRRCAKLAGSKQCMDMLRSLLNSNPYGLSAELNAMDWLLDAGCQGVEKIILYATDTPEAAAAAALLSGYLASRCPGAAIETRSIGMVSEEFWPLLLELVKKLLPDILEETRKGRRVYLNATAGFKPESTAAVITALAAARVAVYYKHEAMKRTVFLPVIPLRLDTAALRDHASKLRMLAHIASNAQQPITIDTGDPAFADIAWALTAVAAAQGDPRRLTLDRKAADSLEVIASIYEAVLARLA